MDNLNKSDAQLEAVAQADAYLNNAGLPTYSQLRSALEVIAKTCVVSVQSEVVVSQPEPAGGSILAEIIQEFTFDAPTTKH